MRKILLLLLVTINMYCFGQAPSYVDTTGLTGWWSFMGNANDVSGHGNTGTITNATLIADRFGTSNSAYEFSGNGMIRAKIPQPYSPAASNFYSTSFWFKKYNNSEKVIWQYKADTTATIYSNYDVFSNHSMCNPKTIAVQNYPAYNPSKCSIDTLGLNQWVNISLIFNQVADSFELYTYGDFLLKGPIGTIQPYYGYLTFANDASGSFGISGAVDDIGVWNRALTKCEIKKLYLSRNSLIVNNPINDTVIEGGTAFYTITDTAGPATYQWQQNSGTGFVNLSSSSQFMGVSTKTLTINPVYYSMNNYQYRCIRTDGITCVDTSSPANLVVLSLSVGNLSENQVIISPNPGRKDIFISTRKTIEKIEVSNLFGQKVISQIPNRNSIHLDIENLTPGIYILRVNESSVRKFIKE